jgi:hypothetical protein
LNFIATKILQRKESREEKSPHIFLQRKHAKAAYEIYRQNKQKNTENKNLIQTLNFIVKTTPF